MKAIHKYLGKVEIIKPDDKGITVVKTKDGDEVNVHTVYVELAGTDTGAGGSDS